MEALALKYGTDKFGHGYILHYKTHFHLLRNKRLKILEIGIFKGSSLRMWRDYFLKSTIFGIDVKEKHLFYEKRIKIFRGDQADAVFLNEISEKISPLDIVIDDGGHVSGDIIKSFKVLFPMLRSGGIYVIEDLHTSYSDEYGGNIENPNNPDTAMNFLKGLTDSLNHGKYKIRFDQEYKLKDFDEQIKAMHFYRGIAFIFKA